MQNGMCASSIRGYAVDAMLACMASLQSVGTEHGPYSIPPQQAAPRIEQQLTAAIGILGCVAGYLFSAIKRGKSGSDMAEEK